jgi:proteasome lid subunit RPN8/RPN11
MITISSRTWDEIHRHGESDFPHECCGLVIGVFDAGGGKLVHEILPIPNAREDEAKRNRFLIAPEDLMRGEMHARRNKLDVLGFYHSHPDHPAVPSAFDLEHAWPVYSYVIVSVLSGKAVDLKSWELHSDRSRFDQELVSKGP